MSNICLELIVAPADVHSQEVRKVAKYDLIHWRRNTKTMC